jgi:coenzyme F420-reducing hydrogenase delta subunit/Pyruvate/2-oxoacid:ferredoxin oxidoreductase delta subunit
MTAKVQILTETVHGVGTVLGDEDFSYQEIPRFTSIKATYATVVTEAFCSDCIICETMCPVLKMDHKRKIMTLNETACKGCGNCIPACPTSALQQRNASYGEIEYDVMDILSNLKEKTPPSCNYCPIRTGDITGIEGIEKNSIRLLCSGRIEPASVINAINAGAGGVFVFGCRFPDFKFENVLPIAEERIKMTEELMAVLGWDKRKLMVKWIALGDESYSEALKKFSDQLGGEDL